MNYQADLYLISDHPHSLCPAVVLCISIIQHKPRTPQKKEERGSAVRFVVWRLGIQARFKLTSRPISKRLGRYIQLPSAQHGPPKRMDQLIRDVL